MWWEELPILIWIVVGTLAILGFVSSTYQLLKR